MNKDKHTYASQYAEEKAMTEFGRKASGWNLVFMKYGIITFKIIELHSLYTVVISQKIKKVNFS